MTEKYYSEDILVAKVQSGEFTMVDYINHHSPEWKEEYIAYCRKHAIGMDEDSAKAFLDFKEEQMEEAMAEGNL